MADNNKLITAILAIVVIISAITILYISLPEEKTDDNQDGTTVTDKIIFNVTYNSDITSYTLEDLEALESYTEEGTYIKVGWLEENQVVTEGPYEYTGVRIATLLDQIDNLPENYSIIAYSSDGRTTDYTKENVTGQVDIYNESGIIIGTSGSTMILAYKIDGEYFEEDTGPIRIAFCNEYYTPSNLWAKMVDNIEIIEE